MTKTTTYDFSNSGTTCLFYLTFKDMIMECNVGDSGSFIFT